MVDTGSDLSSIGEKDLSSLELDFKDLERYRDRPVVGIGGKADTFVMRDVTVIVGLGTSLEKIVELRELLVYRGHRYKKRRRRMGAKVYTREAITRYPSIMGMNLLKELELTLVVNASKEEAYLEG